MKIQKISAEQTWELRQKVMWADKPIEFVKIPNDKDGFHYGLFIDDELTSVISLFKNEEEGQFRKFCTTQTSQKKGYGSILLKALINEAKLLNIKHLWCDARVEAISFYEKFGLKTEKEPFTKNGKAYSKMSMSL